MTIHTQGEVTQENANWVHVEHRWRYVWRVNPNFKKELAFWCLRVLITVALIVWGFIYENPIGVVVWCVWMFGIIISNEMKRVKSHNY